MKQLLGLILVLVLTLSTACEILRQTQYGPICGTVKNSRGVYSSARFYYFTGVPYARPPIGNLRFKEAEPPKPWVLPRNATEQGSACTQIDKIFTGDQVLGSEDCLTLEIAVPFNVSKNNSEKLPVMVWIHGGSFLFWSYKETGPDYFMEKRVVIVSINYRLNVFGFLSTLNQDAPGNMGLKDQTAALIWIKNNIANFGGDPCKVTIFGASAGGAAVQFHMLSPRSKGLFHRAISQSGVTLNTWVFQTNPKEMAFRLGRGLGINTGSTTELVKRLQQVPADVLLKTGFNTSIMGSFILIDEVPFKPSIEHDDRKAFLSHRAYGLLARGKFNEVPYLIGHNTEEGSLPYEYVNIGHIDINIFEKNPSLFIPTSMNIPNNSPCINYTIKAIKRHYFKNTSFTEKVNWIKCLGQSVRGIRKSVELICRHQRENVFFYIFSYVGTNSLSYVGGAGHYSDVLKLFYPVNPEWSTDVTEADRVVQKNLLELWTNFAVAGNPTKNVDHSIVGNLEWPCFCKRKNYVDIGTKLKLKISPDEDDYQFWEGVFHTCGRKPYNTY